MADAVHRRLKTAVGRDHDDFDLGMSTLDVMQEIRSGTIGQFEIQCHEIDTVIVEDCQGCACIPCGKNVEVIPEDLREGRSGGCLIVDDQDCRSMVGCLGDESRRHTVTCIAISFTGQGNRVNTRVCIWWFSMRTPYRWDILR
jgi:hypothetical protein